MLSPGRAAKIIIVGDIGVGKTSIFTCYVTGKYDSNKTPIDCVSKNEVVDGFDLRMQIWDTAGQERFHSVAKMYNRNAVGAFFVFDVTNAASYRSVKTWDKEIIDDRIVRFLVAAKCDSAPRAISREEGLALARELKMDYYETSAKNNDNIGTIFREMAAAVYRKRYYQPCPDTDIVLSPRRRRGRICCM